MDGDERKNLHIRIVFQTVFVAMVSLVLTVDDKFGYRRSWGLFQRCKSTTGLMHAPFIFFVFLKTEPGNPVKPVTTNPFLKQ